MRLRLAASLCVLRVHCPWSLLQGRGKQLARLPMLPAGFNASNWRFLTLGPRNWASSGSLQKASLLVGEMETPFQKLEQPQEPPKNPKNPTAFEAPRKLIPYLQASSWRLRRQQKKAPDIELRRCPSRGLFSGFTRGSSFCLWARLLLRTPLFGGCTRKPKGHYCAPVLVRIQESIAMKEHPFREKQLEGCHGQGLSSTSVLDELFLRMSCTSYTPKRTAFGFLLAPLEQTTPPKKDKPP